MSNKILRKTGIDPNLKVSALKEEDILKIREAIKEERVEGDLRKDVTSDIKRLMEIGTYRGMRHRRGLPCRGQRTRTNARTRRGKRKTMGAGKKKEEVKV